MYASKGKKIQKVQSACVLTTNVSICATHGNRLHDVTVENVSMLEMFLKKGASSSWQAFEGKPMKDWHSLLKSASKQTSTTWDCGNFSERSIQGAYFSAQ